MKMRTWIGCTMIVLMMSAAFAQGPQAVKQEKETWRTVGTIAGLGGGFVLGLGIGLGKYDDAINGDSKVWTLAIVSAVAGGVGGYFAGRAVDRRIATAWKLDPMDRSLLHARHAAMGYGETGGVAH